MKWLHVSDIHFNISGYDSTTIKNKLLQKVEDLDLDVDFILITGDSLYQYNANQKKIREVADYIKQLAKKSNCNNRNIYMCSGNHEVNRESEKRNQLIEDIRSNVVDFSTLYEELCEIGNDKFLNLHRAVTSNDYESYKVIAPKNKQYRIISLNTCLISKDKEDYKKLKVCNDKLIEIGKKIKDDDRVNILIMHHGRECLEAEDAKKFEHWIEDCNIDIVHCGHTHRAAVETYNNMYRDIKQFTAGAVVMDKYAIPSFYLCETNGTRTEIKLSLYTYSKENEEWVIDNHHIRKFKDGIYNYKIFRREEAELEENGSAALKFKTVIDDFNLKYTERFCNDKIYSNKYEGYEKFNSWKIIHSLVDIGVSYTQALFMTSQVIDKITDKNFEITNDVLSCQELRNVVYDTITNFSNPKNEIEFEVSCWASRYARKYSKNTGIVVIKTLGTKEESNCTYMKEKLNYSYVKDHLIKEVMDSITDNTIFYEKLFGNELTRMAESILSFLKNMGIYEIRDEALKELIIEFITQKPHPWLVHNNRRELIKYHKEQAEHHINDLLNNNRSVISQTEAAYHICSAFLVQYDDYIGCTETSPITILSTTINRMTNKEQDEPLKLPMQKYQVVQLKKDLESHSIEFIEFKKNINTLNKNIVTSQKVSMSETEEALIELWGILRKLEEEISVQTTKNPIENIKAIFSSAKGFIVKATLRELKNCFWIEPNWESYEIVQQHLGKQMLVCVIENLQDLENIYSYLYTQKQEKKLTEIVFVQKDGSSFSGEYRKEIRQRFKGKFLKCIFIQDENFQKITKEWGWRKIFYDIIRISRIS